MNCSNGSKDIAEKNGMYLLSDEAYRLLEHDVNDRLPPMADLYARGLSACTLSKPWGGCGITIGWLALPGPAAQAKNHRRSVFRNHLPQPGQ